MCNFKASECYHCKKIGHLARACREKLGSDSAQTKYLRDAEGGVDTLEAEDEYALF